MDVLGRAFNQMEADGTPGQSSMSTSDDEGGEGTYAHGDKLEDEGEEGDPESKRRIMGSSPLDRITIRTTSDPRVVVQTMSEVDILDDGYRWRKYGQKVVKGNPNPRSYYKCTNAGCPVRKHVERAYHHPKSVITTYEGKHNHDVPTASATRHEISMHMAVQSVSTLNGGSPVALSLVMLKPPNHIENGRAPLFPTASNVVSLDLGAGIGQLPESSCIKKQNLTETEDMAENIRGANLTNSGLESAIQSAGTLPFYGN
ncbi:WRKY transcription factor [Nymphaea thermarum]|nr:WRKY transcription factor [Nymphaea thermarum]